jgi:DNA-binding XRE family transcriptional regulator
MLEAIVAQIQKRRPPQRDPVEFNAPPISRQRQQRTVLKPFAAWNTRPAAAQSSTEQDSGMTTQRLPQEGGLGEPNSPQQEEGKLAAIIGRNVRRLREESEWTQEQLAKLAGLDPLALQHIEAARREPTIGELWKVSLILQVPCGSLLQPGETDAAAGTADWRIPAPSLAPMSFG